jgi:hypothetical protein
VFSTGFTGDTQGHFGGFFTGGGGGGLGAGIFTGVSIQTSNAKCNDDLSGPFGYRSLSGAFGESGSIATERFGVRFHAYVLMDNHYHLLIETPEANLSAAMQWLNVSYSVWFNRRHGRAGHLFQGRFQGLIIEDDAGWQEVARYVHLNPVRLSSFGDQGTRDLERGRPRPRDFAPARTARTGLRWTQSQAGRCCCRTGSAL